MKKIIVTILMVSMLGLTNALSVVDGIENNKTNECNDRRATNYGSKSAPCMYILTSNYNDNKVAKPFVNIYEGHKIIQPQYPLIDTSKLYTYQSQNANHFNRLGVYYGNHNLIDTYRLYQAHQLNHNHMQLIDSRGNSTNLVYTATQHKPNQLGSLHTRQNSLAKLQVPTRFSDGFTSMQAVGNILVYGKNNQYLAIDTRNNKVLFETTINQIIESAFTGSQNHTIITTTNTQTRLQTAYLITVSGDVSVVSGVNAIFFLDHASATNKWKEDVIVTASINPYQSNTWQYVVLNYSGDVLETGISYNSVQDLEQRISHQSAHVIASIPTPKPAIVTTTPAKLIYRITYETSSNRRDGYKTLINPSCATNGSVESLWIKKRTGDMSFGIGIEINNKFSNEQYLIKKGDQLCCRVSNRSNRQNTAGGCIEIK